MNKKILISGLLFLLILSFIPLSSGNMGLSKTSLHIVTDPVEKVTENELLQIWIFNNLGGLERNVDITVGWSIKIYTTGDSGMISIYAPEVDQDIDYTITASKSPLQSDSVKITVKNVEELKPLYIAIDPSPVTEEEDFNAIITTENSEPVEDAFVTFEGVSLYTDEFGITTFSAPEVEETTSIIITAQKEGCHNVIGHVNVEDTIESEDMQLYINSPDSVKEGESFYIVITEESPEGLRVVGVDVEFYDYNEKTDNAGAVYFDAPFVDEDTYFDITASKPDYLSATIQILVEDVPESGDGDGDGDSDGDGDGDNVQNENIVAIVSVTIDDENVYHIDVDTFDSTVKINFYITKDGAGFDINSLDGKIVFQTPEDSDIFFDGTEETDSFHSGKDYKITIFDADGAEHNILIMEAVEALGGTTSILWYIGICVLMAVLFVGLGEISKRF